MRSRFRGARPDTFPLTDPDVLAFAVESGATDLTGLDNLVKYLKAESLYSNFVIYPMKSAQNAGSGGTVYSLGGLTTNDMTLMNAPAWALDGIDFDGINQYGLITDFSGGGSLTLFARVKDQIEPVSTGPDAIFGQWDTGANKRSALLAAVGSGNVAGPSRAELLRSADGVASGIYTDNLTTPTWADDHCIVAEWTDGGGRKAWIDKIEETLTLKTGSAQTARFNTDADFSFASLLSSGVAGNFATLTSSAAAAYEGILTTTQRETITDFINAL